MDANKLDEREVEPQKESAMMALLGKLFRSVLYIGIAVLIGYYNFEVNGIIGLVTNLVFGAIGILVTHTWLSQTKNVSAVSLEKPSSYEPATAVSAVEPLVSTDKEAMSTPSTIQQGAPINPWS